MTESLSQKSLRRPEAERKGARQEGPTAAYTENTLRVARPRRKRHLLPTTAGVSPAILTAGRLCSRPKPGWTFGIGSKRAAGQGFTLLELVIAVTLLAAFLLPLMLIVSKSQIRAIKFTHERELRDLAQRKLFDRIHYYEDRDQGDFATEGHPSWTWDIPPPEMVGQGEQPLLEYAIRVAVPQQLEGQSPSSESGVGSTYELKVWTFPDERWYEEQQYLYDQGQYSPLFGDPRTGY